MLFFNLGDVDSIVFASFVIPVCMFSNFVSDGKLHFTCPPRTREGDHHIESVHGCPHAANPHQGKVRWRAARPAVEGVANLHCLLEGEICNANGRRDCVSLLGVTVAFHDDLLLGHFLMDIFFTEHDNLEVGERRRARAVLE